MSDVSISDAQQQPASDGKISPIDDVKLLLEFFKDNTVYQRHHEDIRFKGSQLVVTLAGALVAFLKLTDAGNFLTYTAAVFIVLLGLLGIAQVLKHTERADRHATIARSIRQKIGELTARHGGTSITDIHREAASVHRRSAGLVYRLRARWFWFGMHISIVLIGLTILIANFCRKA